MSSKFLILGKSGQVGRALCALLGEKALAPGREQVDLGHSDFIAQLDAFAGNHSISAVINAAAYTQVDLAEGAGREDAFTINEKAVAALAAWCNMHELPLVHYSTDYVFGGNGTVPHRETDTPSPLNIYGKSKLAGERAIAAAGGRYLILRTSWVYDAWGRNFFTTIRRLLRERETLSIVADQIGAPTYAPHLAEATLGILEKDFVPGIYHVCNSGETSWYGFAQTIAELSPEPKLCKEIHAIPSNAYPTPAPRPLNSRLDCGLARETFGVTMLDWKTGLSECFAHL
jgi:dTDP-4-dehydrorhamnose reductase